jgi:hypothetical protein
MYPTKQQAEARLSQIDETINLIEKERTNIINQIQRLSKEREFIIWLIKEHTYTEMLLCKEQSKQ